MTDSGIGIPACELPHLFEPFRQVQGAQSRPHEGTGTGLATVQRIIRRHGGDIEASGTPGRGAVFSFTPPETAPCVEPL